MRACAQTIREEHFLREKKNLSHSVATNYDRVVSHGGDSVKIHKTLPPNQIFFFLLFCCRLHSLLFDSPLLLSCNRLN